MKALGREVKSCRVIENENRDRREKGAYERRYWPLRSQAPRIDSAGKSNPRIKAKERPRLAELWERPDSRGGQRREGTKKRT